MALDNDDVCRLCLSKDNLVWIFDKRFISANNLKDVIFITTGVEIHEKDDISQKICKICCNVAIKMFQFRDASQKHDRFLREKHKKKLKPPPGKYESHAMGATIETQNKVEPKIETRVIRKINYRLHPSVRGLFQIYPQLKLPSTCLTSNIEPCIMMEMDTVENFLKKEMRNKLKRVRLPKHENRIVEASTTAASIASDPLHISITNAEKNCENDRLREIASNKSEFTIVSVSEIVDENSNKGGSLSVDDWDGIRQIIKPKKRRLSDSDFCSDSGTNTSSSSEKLPAKKSIADSSEGLCLDKSRPLFICNICNSVHGNVKRLKRHQSKHLRCQFCGSKFNTIDSKEAHIKSLCAIKNMMTRLPSVALERVEMDLKMRTEYPEAFIGYPSIPGMRSNPISTDRFSGNITSEVELSRDNTTTVKDLKAVGYNSDDDVIEILSDDDSSSPPRNYISYHTSTRDDTVISGFSTTKSTITEQDSAITASPIVLATIPAVVSSTSSVISTTPLAISTTPPVISTTPPVISATPPVVSTTPPVVSTPPSLTPVALEDGLSSVSVVKPEIRITHSSVIDTLDPKLSDIKIAKELLVNHTTFKLKNENSSQTELPCNKPICIDGNVFTAEFKHLKSWLSVYRIPIFLQKGDFQAQYNSNWSITTAQQPNNLSLWNDLIPIDVQEKSIPSNNNGLVPTINTSEGMAPNFAPVENPSNCTKSTTNPFNSRFGTVPNQPMYNTSNGFSTPASSFPGLYNIPAYPQIMASNFGIASEAQCSKDLPYMRPISAKSCNGNIIPRTAEVTSVLAKRSMAGNDPGANGKPPRLQKTPISYQSDMRGPPNVNPFAIPNVPAPRKSPVVSQNSMINTSNVDSSHSMIYNLQNSSVVQNKMPDLVPDLRPVTTASSSNTAGSVFGSIRVKSVWELK